MLPPKVARTFYNAADALAPPAPGAVVVDPLPAVEARLAAEGPAAAEALVRALRRLEWIPLLHGHRRGFSRLSRADRRCMLEGWSHRAHLEHLLAPLGGRGRS